MTDTVTPTPKVSTTLASPKLVKSKPPLGSGTLSNIPFGCEHVSAFARSGDKNWKTMLNFYTKINTALQENSTALVQTYKAHKHETAPSIKPTYLCMQCPNIYTQEGARGHWMGGKQHSFYVESRTGHLYCSNCEDFVYDAQFEAIRLQRTAPKKRKYDDYAEEDTRLVTLNSTSVPCRAIGLRGLYNMGNTCFMSVVLQSLLHNPFLRAFYLSRGHPECKDDTHKERCTSCALDEIFTEFHATEKTEGYGAVMMLIRSWKSAEHLAGYQQQDAHEYMQFILNSLHSGEMNRDRGGNTDTPNGDTPVKKEDVSDAKCTCIIHKTFYGKLQSTVTCDKCKNTTTAVDPFMDLSLDLRIQAKKKRELNGTSKKDKNQPPAVGAAEGDDQMQLSECLRRFTSEEKLSAADYTCAKCKESSAAATKQLSVRRLPPVLSIHLKRFSHTKDKSSKLETSVSFPLSLDMGPYTAKYRTLKSQPKSSPNSPSLPAVNYTLSAVIVHKGEINSGHYVSYAREGKDWFLFDDSKVVLVSEGEVLNAEAYLLVYVTHTVT